jgi:hypothetical protein
MHNFVAKALKSKIKSLNGFSMGKSEWTLINHDPICDDLPEPVLEFSVFYLLVILSKKPTGTQFGEAA